jgi:hypothetical protein
VYVIYYNYRVIHISHLIVVVLFKLFAKTEKITMEDSRKANGMLKYRLHHRTDELLVEQYTVSNG